MITGIINSEKYQNLQRQSNNVHKSFSSEHEAMINKLREKIEKLSLGIKKVAYPVSSEMVLKITFIYIVELLGESKTLIDLFVNLIITCPDNTRKWILYSNNEEINYEYMVRSDKSLKYRTNINSEDIQKYASLILLKIVDKVKFYFYYNYFFLFVVDKRT